MGWASPRWAVRRKNIKWTTPPAPAWKPPQMTLHSGDRTWKRSVRKPSLLLQSKGPCCLQNRGYHRWRYIQAIEPGTDFLLGSTPEQRPRGSYPSGRGGHHTCGRGQPSTAIGQLYRTDNPASQSLLWHSLVSLSNWASASNVTPQRPYRAD